MAGMKADRRDGFSVQSGMQKMNLRYVTDQAAYSGFLVPGFELTRGWEV